MMQICVNENGSITGFCTLGEMEGSIPYDGAVPDDFAEHCRDYRLTDGKLVPDPALVQTREQQTAEAEEAFALQAWFSWYDNQCMQYARAQRLGEPFDQNMVVLDLEAREKQMRLRELQNKIY